MKRASTLRAPTYPRLHPYRMLYRERSVCYLIQLQNNPPPRHIYSFVVLLYLVTVNVQDPYHKFQNVVLVQLKILYHKLQWNFLKLITDSMKQT
jgi:hypothetical protein